MSKPKLVIIGAGFAGLNLASHTSSFLDVTIIDRKDFFEFNVGNPRSIVDTSFIDRTQFLYKEIQGIGNFVQGTVVSLDWQNKVVVVADGRSFPFDYAAICTGSLYPDAVGKPPESVTTSVERTAQLQGVHSKVRSAASVLVVGGGPTGVELAAEILEKYPGKQVTLVHSGGKLLNRTDKMAAAARRFLEARGARVILNDKVKQVSGSTTRFETASGQQISAEVVFWAIAGRADTAFLRESAPHVLDDKGQVLVDDYQRVVGLDGSVFALGDVDSMPQDKVVFMAVQQAQLLAKNLKLQASSTHDRPPPKLTPWKPGMGMPSAGMVSLGSKAGTGHFGSFTFPSCLVTMVKSKHMMADKVGMNLPLKPKPAQPAAEGASAGGGWFGGRKAKAG